jgi:hypothetical protein
MSLSTLFLSLRDRPVRKRLSVVSVFLYDLSWFAVGLSLPIWPSFCLSNHFYLFIADRRCLPYYDSLNNKQYTGCPLQTSNTSIKHCGKTGKAKPIQFVLQEREIQEICVTSVSLAHVTIWPTGGTNNIKPLLNYLPCPVQLEQSH